MASAFGPDATSVKNSPYDVNVKTQKILLLIIADQIVGGKDHLH